MSEGRPRRLRSRRSRSTRRDWRGLGAGTVRRTAPALALLALGVLLVAAPLAGAVEAAQLDKRPPGEFFELRTRDHALVLQTGLYVTPGDRFLSPDNQLYVVVEVEGDTAWVERVATLQLPEVEPATGPPGGGPGVVVRLTGLLGYGTPAEATGGGPTVAIYHSHSAEAYEPTDGDAFVENGGGIFAVGEAMASTLEEAGVRVLHNTSIHEPHDAQAYQRSRRTIVNELLPEEPDLLVDVHRDTTPADAYLNEVEGEQVAQVMLVVGRQNPNVQANDAFAQRVKATVDERQPGLMRGIFYADGDYNQDLSERLILVEIGSHENRREDAEAGAARFGQVVPEILGAAPSPAERQAPWVTVLMLVLVVGGGGFLWLVMNEGGVDPALARLRGHWSRWFGLEGRAR